MPWPGTIWTSRSGSSRCRTRRTVGTAAGSSSETWLAARLDALAALGRRDDVEEEAPGHARRPSYLRPFALRALGRVRGDSNLVRDALADFESLGLDWHAAETKTYL